ncbi:MAG: glycine betaine/L-proline ABC transporter substrate-binding protein ProX [Desulfohalobiaceae bacterium]|nr:glycine betaine/L-proline ABC transporter substrate-binding protein ProX [Desulfohalobiaceae bacterium]
MSQTKNLFKFCLVALLAVILTFISTTGQAYQEFPGKGVTVRQGRCTWDTGYFHETLVRRALAELGYETKEPKMLQNPLFYVSVMQGSIDFWANSWFPNQYPQLPKNFYEKADAYGYVVKSGGLQGYLIDKKHQEKFNITSLADFKREEVKKAFDTNGDGKADLVGCPPGWNVANVMAHHLKVYDLEDHVNLVQASYNAMFADVLANFMDGNGVLYYTWAPNWTINRLKPGEDVVWINVPEISPMEEFADKADQMVASGVEGAVSDPIKLGFIINDIRIVANKKFARENPAAQKLFEVFKVSVEDISAQNAKMRQGEDSQSDIDRHVEEWIAANPDTWESWLEEARMAAP